MGWLVGLFVSQSVSQSVGWLGSSQNHIFISTVYAVSKNQTPQQTKNICYYNNVFPIPLFIKRRFRNRTAE
jgi:hypothetical protein